MPNQEIPLFHREGTTTDVHEDTHRIEQNTPNITTTVTTETTLTATLTVTQRTGRPRSLSLNDTQDLNRLDEQIASYAERMGLFRRRGDEYLTRLNSGNLAMARSLRRTDTTDTITTQKTSIFGRVFSSCSRTVNETTTCTANSRAQEAALRKLVSKEVANATRLERAEISARVQEEVSRQLSQARGERSSYENPSSQPHVRRYRRRRRIHSDRKSRRFSGIETAATKTAATETPGAMEWNVRITPKIIPGETRPHRASVVATVETTPPPPYPPVTNTQNPMQWNAHAGVGSPPGMPITAQSHSNYQFTPYFQTPHNPSYQPGPWIYAPPQEPGSLPPGHPGYVGAPAASSHAPAQPSSIVPQSNPNSLPSSAPAVAPVTGVLTLGATSGPNLTRHVCTGCGAIGLTPYHGENVGGSGKLPIPEYCGQCQKDDASDDTSSVSRKNSRQTGNRENLEYPRDGGDSAHERDHPNVRESKQRGTARKASSEKEKALAAAKRVDNPTGSYVRISPDTSGEEHSIRLAPSSELVKDAALNKNKRRVKQPSESSDKSIPTIPISEEKLVVEQTVDNPLHVPQGQQRISASSSAQRRGERITSFKTYHPKLPSDVSSLREGSAIDVTTWYNKYSKDLPPEVRSLSTDEVIATREHFEGPLYHEKEELSSHKASHTNIPRSDESKRNQRNHGSVANESVTNEPIDYYRDDWEARKNTQAERTHDKKGSAENLRHRTRKGEMYSELRRGDLRMDQTDLFASDEFGKSRRQRNKGKETGSYKYKSTGNSVEDWIKNHQEHHRGSAILNPPPAPLEHPSPLLLPRRTQKIRTSSVSHRDIFRDTVGPVPTSSRRLPEESLKVVEFPHKKPERRRLNPEKPLEHVAEDSDPSSGYVSSDTTTLTAYNVGLDKIANESITSKKSDPNLLPIIREGTASAYNPSRPKSTSTQRRWDSVPRGSPESARNENNAGCFIQNDGSKKSSNHRSPFVRCATDGGTEILRRGSVGPENSIELPYSRGLGAMKRTSSKGKGKWESDDQQGSCCRVEDFDPEDSDPEATRKIEEAKRALKILQADRGSPTGHLVKLIDEHGRPVVEDITPHKYITGPLISMNEKESHVAFQGMSETASTANTANSGAIQLFKNNMSRRERNVKTSNSNDGDNEWGLEQSLSSFGPPRPSDFRDNHSMSYDSAGNWHETPRNKRGTINGIGGWGPPSAGSWDETDPGDVMPRSSRKQACAYDQSPGDRAARNSQNRDERNGYYHWDGRTFYHPVESDASAGSWAEISFITDANDVVPENR